MKKKKAVIAKLSLRGKHKRASAGAASAKPAVEPMSPRVMSRQYKVLAEGDRLSELKVNTPGLIYYFVRRFKDQAGSPYPISTIIWSRDGANLKRQVLDDMNMRLITVDEMKEFVEWVFKNKPQEKWDLGMFHLFYKDWIKNKIKGDGRKFTEAREQKASGEHTKAARRLEEKQFIDFLVEGFSDDLLNRRQYALALDWRARNLIAEQKFKIAKRQSAKYSSEVLKRLSDWRREIDDVVMSAPVDYRRLFVVELARNKEMTVGETLDRFYREGLKPLFSVEELAVKDLDEIPFSV
jgi:hypothetical protein